MLIETSGRVGQIALARDGALLARARLDESRRHARDLAAAVQARFQAEKLVPADCTGVIVGLGPGSYTGLRVGLASAKAFAYALNCPLVAVPTFRAIVAGLPAAVTEVEIIADGLQGVVYAERFRRGNDGWESLLPLALMPVAEWAARLRGGDCVTGPGLGVHAAAVPPGVEQLAEEFRLPTLAGLLQAAAGTRPCTREELFNIEPLYLRGSSAEEKLKAQSVNAAIASERVL